MKTLHFVVCYIYSVSSISSIIFWSLVIWCTRWWITITASIISEVFLYTNFVTPETISLLYVIAPVLYMTNNHIPSYTMIHIIIHPFNFFLNIPKEIKITGHPESTRFHWLWDSSRKYRKENWDKYNLGCVILSFIFWKNMVCFKYNI